MYIIFFLGFLTVQIIILIGIKYLNKKSCEDNINRIINFLFGLILILVSVIALYCVSWVIGWFYSSFLDGVSILYGITI